MSRTRLFRRALIPTLLAGTAFGAAVVSTANPASAQSRPGIKVTHYQMTATESWNACGGSDAVLHFYDESATMTLNCGTGQVTIYTLAN